MTWTSSSFMYTWLTHFSALATLFCFGYPLLPLVTFFFLLHSLLPRGLSSWLKLSSDMCILFCSRDPLQSHTISSPLLSWELSSSLSTFVCLRVTLLPMTFSSGYDTLSTMTRSLKVKSNLFDLIWFTVFNATFSNISAISWRPFVVEYPERITDHGQATGKPYHLRLWVECTLFVIYKAGREPTPYW